MKLSEISIGSGGGGIGWLVAHSYDWVAGTLASRLVGGGPAAAAVAELPPPSRT